MSARGWLLFAAMAIIWGIPYLLIKVAVAEVSPATVVFARTFLGAALLLPVAVTRGDLAPVRRHWRVVLLYTLVEIGLPWVLLSDAEQRLSSSLAGLLVAGVPLVGSLLAWTSGGSDRPSPRGVIGLVVGLIGVALVVGLDVAADDLVAVGEVGLVVLGYSIGAMLIGRQLRDVPASGVIAASLTITAVAYLPVALAQLPRAIPSPSALAALIVLGVVCTALAFTLFFALIREVGAVRGTIITYFNPAVAIILGVIVLGERFTFSIAAGFVLILVGSFLATRRPSIAARAVEAPPQVAAP